MPVSLREAFAIAEIVRSANPATHTALASFAVLNHVRRGEHVFRDRDEVHTVYIVVAGMVSLYKINSLGERRVVFALGPGKMINEVILDDLPASVNCEALEDSLILCFESEKFLDAMSRDFEFSKAVVDSLSNKVRRLYRQLKNASGSLRGDKRLAAKLWKLATDYGVPDDDGVRIDARLSVTYLADMLGAKRETVSRQLGTLAERGLVAVRRNDFVVPDPDALARYFKSEIFPAP